MRRNEKAVTDPEELYRIIDRCDFCRMGMINGTFPYIVPLCFVRSGHTLLFHSAREGFKIDLLRNNPNVCFAMERNVSVVRSEISCRWGVRYESITGTGSAVFVDDPAEKKLALTALMRKYGSTHKPYSFDRAEIDATCIVGIGIISLTGKRS